MRHVGLLATRLVLGGYLTVHGVKKLSGYFGGPGLDATATGFEALGMRPGKVMAVLAGVSQVGGGVLTVTGIADPLGPMLIAGNMTVATAALRKKGPMSQDGGYELPLTNLAVAVALMSSGAGCLRLGPPLSKSLVRISFVVGIMMAVGSLTKLLRERPPVPTAHQEVNAVSDNISS